MWPRQSLVAISDARSDLTTVTGFGRDSNPQPSDSETNPLSPRPRPHDVTDPTEVCPLLNIIFSALTPTNYTIYTIPGGSQDPVAKLDIFEINL